MIAWLGTQVAKKNAKKSALQELDEIQDWQAKAEFVRLRRNDLKKELAQAAAAPKPKEVRSDLDLFLSRTDLSASEVADVLSVSKQMLSAVRTGERNLSTENAARLQRLVAKVRK
jgi:transcriptional regulator with XRE-family HTH domain